MIEKMKTLLFIFADSNNTYAFEKLFGGQSSYERCLLWANEIDDFQEIVVLCGEKSESFVKNQHAICNKKISFVKKSNWNNKLLVDVMNEQCLNFYADSASLVFASFPFLDKNLAHEVIATHFKYMAEYTFADGYPEGFAPVLINAGSLSIISSLIEKKAEKEGEKFPYPSSVFEILRADINSFEIEVCMAPEDYRMERFNFSCDSKINMERCVNLYNHALDGKVSFTPVELTGLAKNSASVLKTVPAFYYVQLTDKFLTKAVYNPLYDETQKNDDAENVMSLEKFKALVFEIKKFSEDCTVGLSFLGDPLTLENFPLYVKEVLNQGLSVLVETEGINVTESLAENIKNASGNNVNKIDWVVSIDAQTEAKYLEIHKDCPPNAFALSVNSVSVLNKYFNGHVYPQFVRMNENEDELEAFFRFWHEKDSPSSGNVLIQKYDSYCSKLQNRKSCDLTPVERICCWHLKRDFCILSDGSVPMCKSAYYEKKYGNVFDTDLNTIWRSMDFELNNQINKKYCSLCEACDEYYTFNF